VQYAAAAACAHYPAGAVKLLFNTCVGADFDAVLHECLTVSEIHLLCSQLVTGNIDQRKFTTDSLSASQHPAIHPPQHVTSQYPHTPRGHHPT